MMDYEKQEMLEALVGVASTDADYQTESRLLTAYLNIAGQKIINRAYPYSDNDVLEVPTKYELLQVEIAAYLWNKRGAEGETVHNENGVNRTYGSADVPEDMLQSVVPFCGVIKL